jgi:hypothetical protein
VNKIQVDREAHMRHIVIEHEGKIEPFEIERFEGNSVLKILNFMTNTVYYVRLK